MEEIKVGEYVRTSTGNIGKVYLVCPIVTDEAGTYYKYILEINEKLFIKDSDDIVRHSTNIIDLIEENDLLKIEYKISNNEKQTEVVEVIRNYQGILYVNTFVGKFFIQDLEHYDRKILSIVTKEIFNQIKYEV